MRSDMITEDYCSLEDFTPIRGFEEYLINKEGKVYSTKNKKMLSLRDRHGYLAVTFSKNNKRYDFFLHRLLALTFIPNPNNKLYINHIDGNKHNNSLDNLEWCTGSENVQHAYDIGLAQGHRLNYTPELRYKLGNGWRGKHRSDEVKEKLRKAMLGKKYDELVRQKHKDYCSVKSKEHWSEYFKSIPRKTRKVKSMITGVVYNSVKDARISENVATATMTRKLKEGKDYVYVD